MVLLSMVVTVEASELPLYTGNKQEWEILTLSYFKDKKYLGITDNKEILISLRDDFKLNIFDSERSRMWIILGYLHKFEIIFILSDLKGRGVPLNKISKSEEYIKKIELINKCFENALTIDKGELAFEDMEMMQTVITNADIKNLNARRQLMLIDKGIWPSKTIETEHPELLAGYDYKLYERIITAYVDEARFDDALAVINNEMLDRFPYKQKEIKEGIANIQKRKEHFLLKEAQKSDNNKKMPQPFSSKNTEQITYSVDQSLVSKTNIDQTESTNNDMHNEANQNVSTNDVSQSQYGIKYLLPYIISVLFLCFIVLVYFVRKKKK